MNCGCLAPPLPGPLPAVGGCHGRPSLPLPGSGPQGSIPVSRPHPVPLCLVPMLSRAPWPIRLSVQMAPPASCPHCHGLLICSRQVASGGLTPFLSGSSSPSCPVLSRAVASVASLSRLGRASPACLPPLLLVLSQRPADVTASPRPAAARPLACIRTPRPSEACLHLPPSVLLLLAPRSEPQEHLLGVPGPCPSCGPCGRLSGAPAPALPITGHRCGGRRPLEGLAILPLAWVPPSLCLLLCANPAPPPGPVSAVPLAVDSYPRAVWKAALLGVQLSAQVSSWSCAPGPPLGRSCPCPVVWALEGPRLCMCCLFPAPLACVGPGLLWGHVAAHWLAGSQRLGPSSGTGKWHWTLCLPLCCFIACVAPWSHGGCLEGRQGGEVSFRNPGCQNQVGLCGDGVKQLAGSTGCSPRAVQQESQDPTSRGFASVDICVSACF